MSEAGHLFGDYLIFLDESGDHGLSSIDPEFPIFVLIFVVIEKAAYLGSVIPSMKQLKFRFWGHDAAILHAHEIRKPRGDFAFLQVRDRREAFMTELTEVMEKAPATVIAIAIEKQRLTRRYKQPFNPYHLALGLGMERVSYFLAEHGQQGRLTHLMAEARGDREDRDLELEFRRVMDGEGSLPINLRGGRFDIRILSKKVNAEGLQLADLFAHPIARHVLKPDQPNRAFDVIAAKFMRDKSGASMGLKVFP